MLFLWRYHCHQVPQYCPQMAYFNILDSCLFYPPRAEYPTCYGPNFTCPKLEVPPHGYLDVTGLTVGSKAEYECSVLFIRKGSRKRICLVHFSRNSEVERPFLTQPCAYTVFRSGFKTSLIFVFSTTPDFNWQSNRPLRKFVFFQQNVVFI